ncbi:MAG: AmmeMemoRadiSam system protein A [Candidatus Omnitrophica bacterium]|nr:AmmeMemoRadiSam system protein A [Candidatus Omnitrophota bacterium]
MKIATASIKNGLRYHQPLAVLPEEHPVELREPRAVFVTLTIDGELRGCVGTLEANRALVANVATYAFAAAFSDTRFPPLTAAEAPQVKIQISILSELEPIWFKSEAELLTHIRAGVDGLLLEERNCRGTLLPTVWQDIPNPRNFLERLKMKAGLPPNYWSDSVQVHRYTTTCL